MALSSPNEIDSPLARSLCGIISYLNFTAHVKSLVNFVQLIFFGTTMSEDVKTLCSSSFKESASFRNISIALYKSPSRDIVILCF